MSDRVLIFAPFGHWIVHTQLDCVLGAALKNRGCEVKVLSCDGLFQTCLGKGSPLDESKCLSCQKTGAEWFSRFDLEVVQMRSLLPEAEQERARSWSEGIDMDRFGEAQFDGHPMGRWMLWATHGALRTARLDFTQADVRQRARDLAYHGALISIAVTRMLDEFDPGIAICYSGSNSYYRVFCELARARGVRGLVHERGVIDGAFTIGPLMPLYEAMAHPPPNWDSRKDFPLDEAQLKQIVAFLEDRAENRDTNFQALHRFQSDAQRVRQRLRLGTEKKILLALASGDWEFGMFASFGGLHVLWPSQFQWLEETARVCQERGWQLVIRHHPLGAGKTTYPRASAFISEILQKHPQFAKDVRIVMPAENVSTYDLFLVADAVVHQFTRAGAEAYARGVPAVAVADSVMTSMGFPLVRQREDYAPALEQAIAKSPCISEEAMILAFRLLYYRSFVLSGELFDSVRVKNVYEPDFRLNGPEDLVPGVDARLDEICDHLMTGAPLNPLPKVRPSEEAEAAFFKGYRQQIMERRAALLAGFVDRPDPAITVLRACASLPEDNTPAQPQDWRCRHRNVDICWMRADAGGGMDGLAFVLGGTAEDLATPYICLLAEGARLDESAISQAVDALELPENQAKDGVLFGCYALDEAGNLGPEWNTATHPPDSADLPPRDIEALTCPLGVLSLVLWRRERVASWLDEMTRSIGDHDEIWCGTMLRSLLDQQRFWHLREPAVILEAVPSRAAVLASADRKAETGDLDGALALAGELQKRHGLYGNLRLRLARWLIGAKQHPRALALIQAAFKAGEGSREGWDELQRALPETVSGKRQFEDFWPAVDSVLGYMVPGQEKFLHQKALTLPRNANLLEIGSCQGRSTVALAYACMGTRRRIVSVDTFRGSEGIMKIVPRFKHIFRGNLRRLGLEPFVCARPGYSHPVLRAIPEEEMFDFAFIDASHEYADVLLDFELAYARVKPGGWIAFHDVEPGWPGSWRVWEQTGKRLLSNHEYCSTIACGRKEAGVPWRGHETEWPGFRVAYANSILEKPELKEAAQALLDIGKTSATDPDRKSIEDRVATAPEPVRKALLWGVTKEKETDPWVHYCVGLTQRGSAPDIAARHFAEAAALGLQLAPLP